MIEEVKLSDLITLQRGFDITKREQIEGEIPVISSGGISSFHNEYKVKGPGVVIGRKGTLGTVFFNEGNFWPHDTSLWVKDFKGNDPKFIYYFLKILKFEKFDAGAANPTLNRNHVHSLKLSVPKKKYRPKIASILSAYDDLIENNNQRIQLLEDMAQEIYKEWFVRFRFPGYQDTKFIDKEGNQVPHGSKDAIPEGWDKVRLDKYINFEKGVEPGSGNYESEKINENYVPFLRVGDLGSRDSNIYIDKDLSKGKMVCKEDILITLDGTVGKVAMGLEGCFSSGLRKIVYKTNLIKRGFTYFTLLSANIQGTIQAHAAGTTILHASSSIKFMKILIPNSDILEKFEAIVNPMLSEVLILKDKNQILQETRDLLLPRLISGKLSVEDLQVNELLNMAAEPQEKY